jgi:hypothetical protein
MGAGDRRAVESTNSLHLCFQHVLMRHVADVSNLGRAAVTLNGGVADKRVDYGLRC